MYKSWQCREAKQRNDIQTAEAEGQSARKACIATIACGIVLYVLVVGINVVLFVVGLAFTKSVMDQTQTQLDSMDSYNP